MKKVRLLSALSILLALTVFSSSVTAGAATVLPANGPKYTFSIATSAAEGAILDISMKYLAKIIQERSNGRITMNVFPAAQLGSDRELLEGCQMGSVTMVIGATAPQVSFVPALAIFDLPNAFKDMKTAVSVLSGFKPTMEPHYAKAQLKLMTLFPTVFRHMSSSKPVRTIEDFKGLKIRTMENKYHLAYWEALGAKPTPLAWTEVYIALQQKLVDAQENPMDVIFNSKIYEQQKYIINSKHHVFVATVVMNLNTWNGLPADYKKFLEECFADATEYTTSQVIVTKDAEFKNKLIAAGLEYIELSDATLAKMRELAQPVYDRIRADLGAAIVDPFLAEIAKAK
ncbi:MAG TPA: TRAP transporter substrate-binding protein [Bacillota bacterium]|nr:TRAP transporter substrate-binding protein [Bacillota bacterium]HOA15479.1 TRAP transporter substrate-binding protein [Bacillota bacterium]